MPSVRVTQEAAEVLAEPAGRSARITQEVLEVPIETTSQSARITQFVLEVLVSETPIPSVGVAGVFPRFF